MLSKYLHTTSIITLLALIVAGNFFISTPKTKAAENDLSLEKYLSYFYNRYSRHLDNFGFVYQAPDYGAPEFTTPGEPREIISLGLYYKYRALAGDNIAREKLRQSMLGCRVALANRLVQSQSFSEAFAAFALVRLADQLPDILTTEEKSQLYQTVYERIEAGILADDTSNRAALSAVYWQAVVNNFYAKTFLTADRKQYFDKLIKNKIEKVIKEDINSGWYEEGKPMAFNPHYHLVTATALMIYGDLTSDQQILNLSKKMAENLRAITFKNGMVEASIGIRPVGLGAQFYLGAGILNYRFGYTDFSTYLNYAWGDRFFSDQKHPDRLEYHATVGGRAPQYHDDISFSNMAELLLADNYFGDMKFLFQDRMVNIPRETISPEITVINRGDLIVFNNLGLTLDQTGNKTTLKYYRFKIGERDKNYGQLRLPLELEQRGAQELKATLTKLVGSGKVWGSKISWPTLTNAYIYGQYTAEEIADTIQNGPRAVHPKIGAEIWRGTENYKKYLSDKGM